MQGIFLLLVMSNAAYQVLINISHFYIWIMALLPIVLFNKLFSFPFFLLLHALSWFNTISVTEKKLKQQN